MKRAKLLTTLGLVSYLAACVSPEQDAARGAAICEKSGIASGTPEFARCVGEQAEKIQDNRDTARMAIAGGLQSYSATSQRNYEAYQRSRPVSCTSNMIGNSMYTNCY